MKHLWYNIANYIRECDKVFIFLCFFATSFGCVAVLSSTYGISSSAKQFITQLLCMLVGFVAAIIISRFNYQNFGKLWPFFAAVGIIPVLLTFYIGYAPGNTDDKAWLILPGNISFQPSELLKVVFIITFSYHIGRLGDSIHKFHNILLLCLHGAIPVLLIHLQGDDGTALIFALMFISMMFVSGIKLRYFVILGSVVVVALPVAFFLIMNEDQQSRIYSLLFPTEADYLGVLWQQWRARIALANGGLFGAGLFNGPSVQSGNIPEGYNDFIFSSIGEELGILGCLCVIILIFAICFRIMKTGHKSADKTGQIICTGVFSMLAFQSIINIGMNLSLIPVIGITLPLFSAGGTSLLCTLLAIGLVMSVYMHRHSSAPYLYGH